MTKPKEFKGGLRGGPSPPPPPPPKTVTPKFWGIAKRIYRIIQVVQFLARSKRVSALHLVQISSSKYGWASNDNIVTKNIDIYC